MDNWAEDCKFVILLRLGRLALDYWRQDWYLTIGLLLCKIKSFRCRQAYPPAQFRLPATGFTAEWERRLRYARASAKGPSVQFGN
jgi:hypothetical protein